MQKNVFQNLLQSILIIVIISLISVPSHAQTGGYSIFHETMVDMTWQEVGKAAKEDAIILLPLAVIEEHGPHMNCGIDTYLGYLISKLTRRELEKRGVKTLIAPPFYWGINSASHVFPGTFTTRQETMKALLYDIYSSLKSWGFKKVFNFITHGDGGHWRTIFESVINFRKELEMDLYIVLSDDDLKRARLTGKEPFIVSHRSTPYEQTEYLDIHAGAVETGIAAAYYPELVDKKKARTLKPTKLTAADLGKWVQDMKSVTPLGYFGDPAGFDAEWGKKYLESEIMLIADGIEEFLKKK
ncbi:creatininase family protein [candidate division KSB1 bacterium]